MPGEMTPSVAGRLRNKAAAEARAEALAKAYCGKVHKTWNRHARCMWRGVKVTGEGPVAAYDHVQGLEIRLYASLADVRSSYAGEVPAGLQIVTMRKGLHRRGVK